MVKYNKQVLIPKLAINWEIGVLCHQIALNFENIAEFLLLKKRLPVLCISECDIGVEILLRLSTTKQLPLILAGKMMEQTFIV